MWADFCEHASIVDVQNSKFKFNGSGTFHANCAPGTSNFELRSDFGVPIPGRVLPPEQWAKTAIKRLPPPGPLDWPAIFGRNAPVVLDLGCGNGRFVITSALARPELDHLGVDILPVVIRYATRRANQRGLANVRLAVIGGYELLAQYVAPASVAEIHLYHPQPYQDAGRAAPPAADARVPGAGRTARLSPGGLVVLQTDNRAYWQYIRRAAPLLFDFEELDRTVARCPAGPHAAGNLRPPAQADDLSRPGPSQAATVGRADRRVCPDAAGPRFRCPAVPRVADNVKPPASVGCSGRGDTHLHLRGALRFDSCATDDLTRLLDAFGSQRRFAAMRRRPRRPAEPTALAALALHVHGRPRCSPAGARLGSLACKPTMAASASARAKPRPAGRRAWPSWPGAANRARNVHERPIDRAVAWLLAAPRQDDAARRSTSATTPSSSAGPTPSETHSWVEPTALHVLALKAAGQARHPRDARGRADAARPATSRRRLQLRQHDRPRPAAAAARAADGHRPARAWRARTTPAAASPSPSPGCGAASAQKRRRSRSPGRSSALRAHGIELPDRLTSGWPPQPTASCARDRSPHKLALLGPGRERMARMSDMPQASDRRRDLADRRRR